MTHTRCETCGQIGEPPNGGTYATCPNGCPGTPNRVPHERALILSPQKRIALESIVAQLKCRKNTIEARGYWPTQFEEDNALILEALTRVLAFQRHAEEAVIVHDHHEQAVEDIARAPTTEAMVQAIAKAWHLAGGRLEAIENGVGTLDVDWRRRVWTTVAQAASAIAGGPEPLDRQAVVEAIRFADNERELRAMVHDEEIAWRKIRAMLCNALNIPSRDALRSAVKPIPLRDPAVRCGQLYEGTTSVYGMELTTLLTCAQLPGHEGPHGS